MSQLLTEPVAPARMDGADLRERNLSVVLHDLMYSQPTSRSEIAERTGLAKASITQLIPELESLGLAIETTTSKPSTGRPSKMLAIHDGALSIIVCEVTELEITTETSSLMGNVLRFDRELHFVPMGGPDSIAFAMANTIGQHLETVRSAGSRTIHLVVVIDAPLSGERPIVHHSSELGWSDPVDLTSMLENLLPELAGAISIVSQVQVAAKAEFDALKRSSESLPKSVVFLKAGSSIGSAVVQNGKLLVGAQGMSPVLGHIEVSADGETCECGRTGCFQTQVSLRKILEFAGLTPEIATKGTKAAMQTLVDRITDGDISALLACEQLRSGLLTFAESLKFLYDPDYIVLGGYWAEIFQTLNLGTTSRQVLAAGSADRDNYQAPSGLVSFRPAQYGVRAARVGAIQEVVTRVLRRPLALKGGQLVPTMGPIGSSPSYIW